MNPCVVTFTSDPHYPGVDALRRSCAKWGWPLVEVVSEWQGEGHRLKSVLAESGELRDQGYTHLVHVDAFDVLAVGPQLGLFNSLKLCGEPPLLLSCEAALWPYSPMAEAAYGPKQSHWWYAHSQFVLDLRQPMPRGFGELANDASDQQHLHNLVMAETPGIKLDRDCRIIQSVAHCVLWQDFFEVVGGRIVNKLTGSMPLFAHMNGRTDGSWVPQI